MNRTYDVYCPAIIAYCSGGWMHMWYCRAQSTYVCTLQWTPLFRTPWEQYSGTPLFRTPWDQYSGSLYSGHLGTSTVDPSIPDTLGPEGTVLIMKVSSFQGLKMYYGKAWRVIWFQWHVSLLEGCLQFRGWIGGLDCT